jgi:hypothetical protein
MILNRIVNWVGRLYIFIIFYLAADGTVEFAKGVRWLFLVGEITEKQCDRIDRLNFRLWQKKHGKDKTFQDYLEVARV